MGSNLKLLNIDEAAKLLGVSRATFNKIRKDQNFSEVLVGKRVRFNEADLLAALGKHQPPSSSKTSKVSTSKNAVLNIFSESTLKEIVPTKDTYDLTKLKQIDPYGALSLLCTLVTKSRMKIKSKLIIDDGVVCQNLKASHFFYQVESHCGSCVEWDRTILEGKAFEDTNMLMSIKAIKAKGAERTIAESLISLLRKQGFGDSLGRGIAHILGELADNAMTHSANHLSDRVCFVSAQRFLFKDKDCIIVGIADPGLGIPKTLKSNPKYSAMSDQAALLRSFRPYVTSWEAMRGKGLADVLGIALGNSSYLRVDSGSIGLLMDFHEKNKPLIKVSTPLTDVTGTRFGLILIDNHFERSTRDEVDSMLEERERELS